MLSRPELEAAIVEAIGSNQPTKLQALCDAAADNGIRPEDSAYVKTALLVVRLCKVAQDATTEAGQTSAEVLATAINNLQLETSEALDGRGSEDDALRSAVAATQDAAWIFAASAASKQANHEMLNAILQQARASRVDGALLQTMKQRARRPSSSALADPHIATGAGKGAVPGDADALRSHSLSHNDVQAPQKPPLPPAPATRVVSGSTQNFQIASAPQAKQQEGRGSVRKGLFKLNSWKDKQVRGKARRNSEGSPPPRKPALPEIFRKTAKTAPQATQQWASSQVPFHRPVLSLKEIAQLEALDAARLQHFMRWKQAADQDLRKRTAAARVTEARREARLGRLVEVRMHENEAAFRSWLAHKRVQQRVAGDALEQQLPWRAGTAPAAAAAAQPPAPPAPADAPVRCRPSRAAAPPPPRQLLYADSLEDESVAPSCSVDAATTEHDGLTPRLRARGGARAGDAQHGDAWRRRREDEWNDRWLSKALKSKFMFSIPLAVESGGVLARHVHKTEPSRSCTPLATAS